MTAIVGLDLGTSAVRAAQLNVGRRGPYTLDRIGQIPLPPGAMRYGEITEPDTIASAIAQLWQRFKFRSRKVALGLANQQAVVRQVDLPYLPEAELRRSLRLQAQEYIPIPIEQAVLDIHVIENLQLADGQRVSRVLLIAAQRSMVDSFLDVVRRAKLEPVGLDLNAFAMLRALGNDPLLAEGESELLLDVGAAVTNVVIHHGGLPLFVRILSSGGSLITELLVERLGMPVEEAEEAKATIGIPEDYLDALADDTARLIAEGANRLVQDIRSSLDYYQSQEAARSVGKAVLTGGASLLPNFRERLADSIGVPVELGHPIERMKVGNVGLGPDEVERAEPFLAVAVGLARGFAA